QGNHNPLVGGSNPSTATICVRIDFPYIFALFRISFLLGLSRFLALPAHRVWHLPVLNGSKRPSLPHLASYILNLPHAWISRQQAELASRAIAMVPALDSLPLPSIRRQPDTTQA
ncbi:hypothetical protein, partial [Komagataeibacter saccharivorans]|uniref:hypothetical protein n=1 Tax=Komagataeibacter saccharivorans TaxID=265959 RepID=UPI0039E7E563